MTTWPKPLIVAAWIGSVLSGAAGALVLIWSAGPLYLPEGAATQLKGSVHWQGYAFAAWLVLACLLLLPPLWKRKTKITAYARIAAGFALFIGAMFVPLPTHAVKIDMPRPPATTK